MFNRISFAVVLLAVCIVMAGVIISAGYSNFGKTDVDIMSLSTLAIVVGLLISVIIVIGIIVSIVRSDREKRKNRKYPARRPGKQRGLKNSAFPYEGAVFYSVQSYRMEAVRYFF